MRSGLQRLAFSHKPLAQFANEGVKHSLDLVDLGVELCIRLVIQEVEVVRQEQLVLHFACGTGSDTKESRRLALGNCVSRPQGPRNAQKRTTIRSNGSEHRRWQRTGRRRRVSWTPEAADACEQLGTDVYISTRRRKHGDPDDVIPNGSVPEDADVRKRMRRKLRTKEGRDTYARRKAAVEPVFGQIKEARGFRRFLLRGQKAVETEWAMVCVTHNLLKLFRFCSLQAA